MKIVVNTFARRQTPDSRFGHFEGTETVLCNLVRDFFHKATPGYRNGVILVPLPPKGFFSGTIPLVPGMALQASYEPRRPGEEPRLHVGAALPVGASYESVKAPAVAVDIVLYSSTVLAENGDNDLPSDPNNWEVVSINPRMCEGEEPIHSGALIANHLQESGGTASNMTDSDFVALLRKSRAYWNKYISLG